MPRLQAAGVEVLLDDRDVRAGVKFKDADLVGIPAPRGHRRARPERRQAGNQVAMGQAGRVDRPGHGRRDDRPA